MKNKKKSKKKAHFEPSYLRVSVTKIFTHDWTTVAAKSVRPFPAKQSRKWLPGY